MSPQTPTGRPYPSASQARPEDFRCNRRCVGVDVAVSTQNPTGRPYPSAAQAQPEGLGCICRCVGVDVAVSPQNPTGRLYPSAAQAGPEGLGCIGRFEGEAGAVSPQSPLGRPYPSAAQAEGLGCISRCVGGGGGGWKGTVHTGPRRVSLLPKGPGRAGGVRASYPRGSSPHRAVACGRRTPPVVGPRAGSSGPKTVLTPRATSSPRGCPLLYPAPLAES